MDSCSSGVRDWTGEGLFSRCETLESWHTTGARATFLSFLAIHKNLPESAQSPISLFEQHFFFFLRRSITLCWVMTALWDASAAQLEHRERLHSHFLVKEKEVITQSRTSLCFFPPPGQLNVTLPFMVVTTRFGGKRRDLCSLQPAYNRLWVFDPNLRAERRCGKYKWQQARIVGGRQTCTSRSAAGVWARLISGRRVSAHACLVLCGSQAADAQQGPRLRD